MVFYILFLAYSIGYINNPVYTLIGLCGVWVGFSLGVSVL